MTALDLYHFNREVQEILKSFFLTSPQLERKPPFVYEWEYEGEKPIGVRLQAALSGFKKEDLSIGYEGNCLKIKGDNSKNTEVNQKFRSVFSWSFSVLEEYFSTEEIEASYTDGLLDIKIPLRAKPAQSIRQISLK